MYIRLSHITLNFFMIWGYIRSMAIRNIYYWQKMEQIWS